MGPSDVIPIFKIRELKEREEREGGRAVISLAWDFRKV